MDISTIRMREVFIIPPGPGQCPMCADAHSPKQPHNLKSLYFQVRFRHEYGRAPTWADALAHCEEPVRKAWIRQLMLIGIEVTEPDGGPGMNEQWIRIADRPPTANDGDVQGCVLVWHIYQGAMIVHFHNVLKNRFFTHWQRTPDPPDAETK